MASFVAESFDDVDYGSRILVDSAERISEIKNLTIPQIYQDHTDNLKPRPLAGVSVIVATYMGALRIETCLRSLAAQTLESSMYEVILVVNGADDGTAEIARTIDRIFDEGQLRVIRRRVASVGGARNVGLAAARFAYVTMVDDDDYIGSDFLAALYAAAGPNIVSVAPIVNIDENGIHDVTSSLNEKILKRRGRPFKFATAPELIGFNACKLIPLTAIGNIRYNEELKSGEDICFMAEIASNNNLDATVVSEHLDSAYYRNLRDDSISRQELNFDFSVMQRLAVMRVLEGLRNSRNIAREPLIKDLINSQANFVSGFLRLNPSQRETVVSAIASAEIGDFPWNKINRGLARDLAISYCFAPYGDTSAVVAAKAIVERGMIVDVISNNMSKVRSVDADMTTIAGRLVENAIEIDSPPSFAGWSQISEFVQKGIVHADRLDANIGGYETVYSRVLWSGSHFLAALFKLRHPATIWTAEFSDPMSFDAQGLPRKGDLVRDELWSTFQRGIRSLGYTGPKSDSLFEWCEYITYVLADELIFTNSNQLEYMLSKVNERKLQKMIREKAVVRIHPAPPERSYHVAQAQYPLSKNVLNIGYFGAFYKNRSLSELLIALTNSSPEIRRKTRIHIFTNGREKFEKEIAAYGLTGSVRVQSYRPYLEFLNLITKFDTVIVNDVESGPELEINPFLPSKYSDYKGAGIPVWSIVEPGSALSGQPSDYESEVGNSAQALKCLQSIFRNWQGHKLGGISGDE